MAGRFVGRPWREVEAEIQRSGRSYVTEIARPERDFFKIDEKYLYVLREREGPEGNLRLILAAICRGVLPQRDAVWDGKEVS